MKKKIETDDKNTKIKKSTEVAEVESVKEEKAVAKKSTKTVPLKKLPKIFKKTYTEKKLNKKIYKKVFVPEDKKYLESIFVQSGVKGKKQIPIFAIPKESMFAKKDVARLKVLAKEIKKQKGRIKFGPLFAVLIFIAAIGIAFSLTKNIIIKKAIQSTCESIFEAKCDIASVDLRFFDSSFKLKGLEIANKNEPMKNLVSIESIILDFDLTQLLRAKFVADELSINGVDSNTDRKTSGDISEKKLKKLQKKKEKQAKKAAKQTQESAVMKSLKEKSGNAMGTIKNSFAELFAQYNPENIIKNCYANLQSPEFAKTTEANVNELIKKWQAKPAELETKVNELTKSSQELLNLDLDSLKTNPTKLKEVIANFNTVLDNSKTIKAETQTVMNDIKKDVDYVSNLSSQIQDTINHDMNLVGNEISKFTSLNLSDGTQFISGLFDNVMYEFLGKYYPYVKKATDKLLQMKNKPNLALPKNKEEKTEIKPKRERLAGRNISYKSDIPSLWIKKASGSGPNFSFQGNNICSDMDKLGKPAIVDFSMDLLGMAHKANLTIDTRSSSTAPLILANYNCDNVALNLPAKTFGSAPGVPDIISKGNLDFVAKVFENDGFELSGTSSFRDMTITTTPFEPVFASDIYSGILAGIKEMILNIQAGFTVSSGLNLKVSSDVDKKITNALSSEMTKQFASIKKAAEEEISKKLNESTGGALGKISDFNQIKTKLDGITKAADSIQEKIEAKKKEAEKLITGKIDSAVEDTKDKLKSNAKDSLKNLKNLF